MTDVYKNLQIFTKVDRCLQKLTATRTKSATGPSGPPGPPVRPGPPPGPPGQEAQTFGLKLTPVHEKGREEIEVNMKKKTQKPSSSAPGEKLTLLRTSVAKVVTNPLNVRIM